MDVRTLNLKQRLRSASAHYAVAFACVALGWAAREAITPMVGPTALPFIFFFPAVAMAAWYGGLGPGVLAICLSAIAANWFFVREAHGWALDTFADVATMGAFILSCSFVVGALEAMHRAKTRALADARRRASAELEAGQQRELLATTLASIGDAVIAADTEGRVMFLNAQAEALTGWKSSEAARRPLSEVFRIVDEKTRQPAESPVEKVLRVGTITGLPNHTLLIAKDGREIPIGDSAAPIRRGNEPLLGVVLVFRDVTLQRKSQEVAARLAAIVEHSGDVMLTKDLDGIIQTWNPSAERLFGYRADEILGKHVTTLFPPDRLGEEDHILDSLREGKPVERFETIRVAKDGRRIPVAISVSPLKNDAGELIGASKVVHDITDLVTAREELVREKELLATTLASIGDAVVVTDPEGRVTFLNAEAERLTKWKGEEASGQPLPNIFRIVNEDTRLPAENPVEKVLRVGGVVGLANHTILIARDGTEIPIDDSAAPIRHHGGPLSGVVLVFRDVTEQKAAERMLRERERELGAVIDQTPFMLTRCSRDLRYRFVSRAYAQMLGKRPEEIVGETLIEIMGDEGFRTIQPHVEKVLQGQRVEFESEVDFKHVGKRHLHVVYTPDKDRTGQVTGWIASLLEISERKEAERKLRELSLLPAQNPAPILRVGGDGTLLYANPAAMGQFPGWRISVGERAPAEVCSFASDALKGRRPLDRELTVGERAYLISVVPIPDLDYANFYWTEVTELNQAMQDLRSAQERLVLHASNLEGKVQERTTKLQETIQELEGFSYSITHDLRAPLRAMQSFSEILIDEHGPSLDETGKDLLRRIGMAAGRMDKLVSDVLVYSRVLRTDLTLEPVDVDALLRGMIETYPNLQPPNADVAIEGSLPRAIGNEAALTQCFSNLLGNAVKFVAPGVRPRVRVSAETVERNVRYWVVDNGIGIESKHLPTIFGMFQRLSNEYDGTGIGLTLVRKAAERMGGAVGVESQPGRGSRFWLELPLAANHGKQRL